MRNRLNSSEAIKAESWAGDTVHAWLLDMRIKLKLAEKQADAYMYTL